MELGPSNAWQTDQKAVCIAPHGPDPAQVLARNG